MNWTDVLTDEACQNSVLQIDGLVRNYKLSEPAVREPEALGGSSASWIGDLGKIRTT